MMLASKLPLAVNQGQFFFEEDEIRKIVCGDASI
jgi:hypothetical protein